MCVSVGVSVYGCVRARVWCMIACLLYPELNQSVLNQNPAKGSTSWPRHLEKILHGQNLPRSWAPGQDLVLSARSWPYGQDLEHLAQDTWTRTFCWVKVGHFCLLEVSHFVSAIPGGKPLCVSKPDVSHFVSASQR